MIDKIATHLEFLGYELQRLDGLIGARHPNKGYIRIKEMAGWFLFNHTYGCQDKAEKDKLGILELINNFNRNAIINRAYYSSQGCFVLEALYPSNYDKASFSAFMETCDHEKFTILLNLPTSTDYLR